MTVGVTGHQNLPRSAIAKITAGIRGELTDVPDLHGVCALAAGADQLFAQLVIQQGGRLHVIIPCGGYEKTFGTEDERVTFLTLLEQAGEVEEMDFPRPSEAAFFAAGRRVVDTSDRVIAVWDGKPARGLGGTADVVAYARQHQKPTIVIWPDDAVR
jgi:hypothetical protein